MRVGCNAGFGVTISVEDDATDDVGEGGCSLRLGLCRCGWHTCRWSFPLQPVTTLPPRSGTCGDREALGDAMTISLPSRSRISSTGSDAPNRLIRGRVPGAQHRSGVNRVHGEDAIAHSTEEQRTEVHKQSPSNLRINNELELGTGSDTGHQIYT